MEIKELIKKEVEKRVNEKIKYYESLKKELEDFLKDKDNVLIDDLPSKYFSILTAKRIESEPISEYMSSSEVMEIIKKFQKKVEEFKKTYKIIDEEKISYDVFDDILENLYFALNAYKIEIPDKQDIEILSYEEVLNDIKRKRI